MIDCRIGKVIEMKGLDFIVLVLFVFLRVVKSSPIENDLGLDSVQKFITKPESHPDLNPNNEFTSICWAESLIITENKLTKNQTFSKSYSIVMDTPEKLKELPKNNENVSCIEILEHNSKKALNFTTSKETKDYIIKEHKTLFCGAGPVLSHHFIVWPKLNRRQIEISINPLSSTKWKHCNEENEVQEEAKAKSAKVSKTKGKQIKVSRKGPKFGSGGKPSGNQTSTTTTSIKSIDSSNESDSSNTIEHGRAYGPNKAEIVGQPSPKPYTNVILRRDVKCAIDSLGTCKKMMEKSDQMLRYSNSSEPVLGKWFFLDSSDLQLDSETSYTLKIKVIVNMENALSGDNKKRTKMVLDEDSLYVIPQRTKN